MKAFRCALAVVLLGAGCSVAAPDPSVEQLTADRSSLVSVDADSAISSTPPQTEENLVVRLQRDLFHLGFYAGQVTAEFDSPTSVAVSGFERALGLPDDGYYDLELAALIDLARGRARGPSIWALQSILVALGYYSAGLDGLYSQPLGEAVRDLQIDAGLEATGVFEESTAAALLEEFRKERPSVQWVFGPDLKPPPAPSIRAEAEPPVSSIALVQERLSELGFRPGPADGQLGSATRAAITAFQKREGLRVDGVIGPETSARLEHPLGAGPRFSSPTPRIEIDLSRQIAFVVLGEGSVTTVPVSSGNGQRYATEKGGTAVAHTPEGAFSVRRVIDGVREAPLGILYRPLYFHRGWAIHGSGHVPAYPASHGCVRVHRWDQDWLFERVGVGTAVFVYSGESAAGIPGDAAAGS